MVSVTWCRRQVAFFVIVLFKRPSNMSGIFMSGAYFQKSGAASVTKEQSW